MNSLILPLLFVTSLSFGQNAPDVASRVAESMDQAIDFILSLYYLIGVAFILGGVAKLKKLGHRTAFMNVDSGIAGPLLMMFVGSALIFSPQFIAVINHTFFDQSKIAELSYQAGDLDMFEAYKDLLRIVQFIGLIALLRGFLILSKATGQGVQPGTISKGFMHIFGGVLAVNIMTTLRIVNNTFLL